ncbi:MAG: DUF1501 domain-containing protein [Pyrinomonadaceae bacterium]
MKQSRREFLIKSSCALSMTALATQMRHFGLVSALAQTGKISDKSDESFAPADYRALVCIFMSGGNDSNNTIVPLHNGSGGVSGYSAYTDVRQAQGLALPTNQLLPMTVPRIGNLNYGLHYNLGTMIGRNDVNGATLGGTRNNGIYELFGQGKLAVVSNVGTLVYPMTRADYQNNTVQKPNQLFSHSDQTAQYQTSRSDRQAFSGWGGLISDLRTAADNPNAVGVPMITSTAGTQLFTSGNQTSALAISDASADLNAALVLNGFGTDAASTARRAEYDTLRTLDLDNQAVAAASGITEQAVEASLALSTFQEVTTIFPTTKLGLQLKQVARLIKKRDNLNIKRQIFFVQMGAFDTHNNQVTTVTSGQNGNMIEVGQAMRAFYDEMVAQGVGSNVTTFTMSDFSRTFAPAGTGSVVGTDHAWASHQLVMGGAARGGDFYGMNTSNGTPFPTLQLGGPDDADSSVAPRGRWIPTTSVEQYAATLSRWFGLPDTQITQVFPNLSHFPTSDLGFMNP